MAFSRGQKPCSNGRCHLPGNSDRTKIITSLFEKTTDISPCNISVNTDMASPGKNKITAFFINLNCNPVKIEHKEREIRKEKIMLCVSLLHAVTFTNELHTSFHIHPPKVYLILHVCIHRNSLTVVMRSPNRHICQGFLKTHHLQSHSLPPLIQPQAHRLVFSLAQKNAWPAVFYLFSLFGQNGGNGAAC